MLKLNHIIKRLKCKILYFDLLGQIFFKFPASLVLPSSLMCPYQVGCSFNCHFILISLVPYEQLKYINAGAE